MTKPESIINYRFTEHAEEQMVRRQISKEEVTTVLAKPGQVEVERKGRYIYQSLFKTDKPVHEYLIRVFVDADCELPEVVTVYRTSKIRKYWRFEK